MSDSETLRTRPNTVPWPPIILVTAVITGWLLGTWLPAIATLQMTGHFPLGQLQIWLGWLLVAMSIAMDIWVLVIFKDHNTNIRPDRPAENLVTSGPFAWSRNPIYLGNVAIVFGLALARGSVWYVILVPMTFLLIQELAIKREEAHIAVRFEDAWTAYASRVRRWL